jgi:hypothetical protein
MWRSCQANNLELVVTPSNRFWLNWIECEFTALRYFALDGSDYSNHRPRERDRRLRPLAQRASTTQTPRRHRL